MPNAVERYLASVPYIAIHRGAPWGFAPRRVFAAAPSVGTSYADVWEAEGDLQYPVIIGTVSVASTSALDAAASSGARTVEVEGLGAGYVPLSEVVALDGTTPVVTVGQFLRVNGFKVQTAGAGGAAVGTLTATILGDVQSVIPPGIQNVALGSHYTVPAGKTAYVVGAKYSSDDGTTRFMLMIRPLGGVFQALEVFQVGTTPAEAPYIVPVQVAEKSDIKVICRRPTSQTALALTTYDLVLAPKTLSAVRSLGNPAV